MCVWSLEYGIQYQAWFSQTKTVFTNECLKLAWDSQLGISILPNPNRYLTILYCYGINRIPNSYFKLQANFKHFSQTSLILNLKPGIQLLDCIQFQAKYSIPRLVFNLNYSELSLEVCEVGKGVYKVGMGKSSL